MLRRPSLPLVLLLAALAAACTTAPRPRRPAQPAGPARSPANPSDEYKVTVTSDPAGAIVVLDGVPVGRTPLDVAVPATARGFCRGPVSVKVRFLASDPEQTSRTVEEILTQLDRVPAALHFTPAGATRTVR